MPTASSIDEPLSSSRPAVTFSVSPALCSLAEFWWSCANVCLNLWWSLLSEPPLSGIGLLRVSTVLTLCHHADLWLEHQMFQQQQQQQQQALLEQATDASPTWPYVFSSSHTFLPLNTTAWWLGVVIMVSGLLLILIVASYPMQDQWVLVTALMSLFCIEALLPIIVMGFTSLWFLKQVSWVTTLGLLCTLWSVTTLLAHWIRCTIYQNLGHG